MSVPRDEYPRPDFVRDEWQSLNGPWHFAFDDDDQGLIEHWYSPGFTLNQTIMVPFAYQTPASHIHRTEHHPVVWYSRTFTVPQEWHDKRILIHFGAVDYEATVWVNGSLVGQHKDGYVPFHFDITPFLVSGPNQVSLRVVDEVRTDQPRGKQTARLHPWGCWYTAVTGIWQSVWLEPVSATRLVQLHLIPDIDREILAVGYVLSQVPENLSIELLVSAEGQPVTSLEAPIPCVWGDWSDVRPVHHGRLALAVPSPKLWSPETPFLYDLILRLKVSGQVVDEVTTYFGMRKVHAERGQVFLNNQPYYQRLVLDQGYWPGGLYTAPDVGAIRRDVELCKALGFNGARKHQKIEDPYYYYFADTLGLLVWSEMPACYDYSEEAAGNLRREWTEALVRDRNHPSIIAWTPLNESWGVDQLQHSQPPEIISYMVELYHLTHSLDGTRLVISNDGWQHAVTDLVTIHEYTQDPEDLRHRLESFAQHPYAAAFSHGRPILLAAFPKGEAPVLVTEFGGIRVHAPGAQGWGYGDSAANSAEWMERMRRLVDSIVGRPDVVGYCYTQLTDVQQEVNGLLTHDHVPKVDPERLQAIFRGR